VTVRVVVADDQQLVRTGFAMILGDEPDIDVVAEASDGPDVVAATVQLRPDVVLMDIRMPGFDGIEATRRIMASDLPKTRVLVLTTFDLDEYVYAALRAGASGFLLKDAPAHQLIGGVRSVASGEALLAPSIIKRLIEEFTTTAPPSEAPGLSDLTERELEVFRLVARGLSNQEIAAELYLGQNTVKTHVARVLMKLDIRDRVQAVVLAYESGIITPRRP
jgi:DNA-binding NarL/FixJ family response regulator